MRASHAACSAALSGALALAMIGTAAAVPPRLDPGPAPVVQAALTGDAVTTTPPAAPRR